MDAGELMAAYQRAISGLAGGGRLGGDGASNENRGRRKNGSGISAQRKIAWRGSSIHQAIWRRTAHDAGEYGAHYLRYVALTVGDKD